MEPHVVLFKAIFLGNPSHFAKIPPRGSFRTSSSGLGSPGPRQRFLPRGVNLTPGDSQESPESSVVSERCFLRLGRRWASFSTQP